jgi:tripartite-type tricarboxylate transporter receptor subunit TctC
MGVISPKRIPGYDIMTMEEAGLKGFTDEAWYGLNAPAKTPPEIVARLGEAMKITRSMLTSAPASAPPTRSTVMTVPGATFT